VFVCYCHFVQDRLQLIISFTDQLSLDSTTNELVGVSRLQEIWNVKSRSPNKSLTDTSTKSGNARSRDVDSTIWGFNNYHAESDRPLSSVINEMNIAGIDKLWCAILALAESGSSMKLQFSSYMLMSFCRYSTLHFLESSKSSVFSSVFQFDPLQFLTFPASSLWTSALRILLSIPRSVSPRMYYTRVCMSHWIQPPILSHIPSSMNGFDPPDAKLSHVPHNFYFHPHSSSIWLARWVESDRSFYYPTIYSQWV
jgi:hypothetical protein